MFQLSVKIRPTPQTRLTGAQRPPPPSPINMPHGLGPSLLALQSVCAPHRPTMSGVLAAALSLALLLVVAVKPGQSLYFVNTVK